MDYEVGIPLYLLPFRDGTDIQNQITQAQAARAVRWATSTAVALLAEQLFSHLVIVEMDGAVLEDLRAFVAFTGHQNQIARLGLV